ncbi:MAG: PA2169 family four-helix-bundle protein [Clostridia bacterium]|nr:PA2169 family four-helix-bundle protein [Clostridia bacterium]
MKDDCTLLNHIRQTTEMGVDGIDSVIQYADGTFRQALEQQRTEYNKIHDSADSLLRKHNGKPEDVGAFAKWSSELSSGMKTMMDSSQSNIADMMIRGNTMGVTKSMQTMRECDVSDHAVTSLANKLLATEQANIDQMKKFL